MLPDLAAIFAREGVVRLPATSASCAWASSAWAAAQPRIADPEWQAAWLRCEGTWFAGVDLLPNAPDGSVAGVPLAGPAFGLIDAMGLWPAQWHAAQVSVTYPGYPRAKEGESAGAARFRMTRDAAHVDGLLPEGQPPRRYLREPHTFILGIALVEALPEASPLVVWPGSHRAMGSAFASARGAAGSCNTASLDLTEPYKRARSDVFATHRRTEMPLAFGEAILLHRHMLHGIAPWRAPPRPEGRAVAYFRPQFEELEDWFAPVAAPDKLRA